MRTLPISTTNMTGLGIMCRGLSLMTESMRARRTMVLLNVAERRLVDPDGDTCWGASGISRVEDI